MSSPNLSELYDPDDDSDVVEWTDALAEAISEPLWAKFGNALATRLIITNIGELREQLDNDVDMAVRHLGSAAAGMKLKLAEYLVKKGRKPFSFRHAVDIKALHVKKSTSELDWGRLNGKKLNSQKDRPTLGLELGGKGLADLALPENALSHIQYSPNTPMPAKGKNGTEAVADVIYTWAVAKFGNAHVDSMFCDRIGHLLEVKYPELKPWGKPFVDEETKRLVVKPRSWSSIIKNRFSNVRSSKVLSPHPQPRPHTLMRSLPPVPLCTLAPHPSHATFIFPLLLC